MVFTSITPFPTTLTPITNISPLTYRDAGTFLEYLETIKQWLNDTLVPDSNTMIENAIEEFQTGIANAEATVNEAKAGWQAEWNEWTTEKAAEYLAFSNSINTAFTTFQATVNTALAASAADITAEKVEWQNSFDAFMADVNAELAALNDAAMVGLVNNPASGTGAAVRTVINAEILDSAESILVEDHKLVGDPDGTLSWQRAVTFAIANNKTAIIGRKPSYTMKAGINLTGAHNLSIYGNGVDATVLNFSATGATPIPAGFYVSNGAASNLFFDKFTVQGTIVDDVTEPRRARTETAVGIESGFIFHGNGNPGTVGAGEVRDITLGDIAIKKTSGLPFQFDGVKGLAYARNVKTYLTMDGGWVFCDHVKFGRLHSVKSADNGFSISRGNKKVTGGSIYAELCAYYAGWIAGFPITGTNPLEIGPTNFTLESVHAENVGMGALNLDNAPKNGKIGSVYAHGVSRGPVDGRTDAGGLAVLVGGYPSTNRLAVTEYAENIFIDSITAIDCARGAIIPTAGVKTLEIGAIHALNCGSQYAADGVTTIASTDTENNFAFGIPSSYGATVSNIKLGDVSLSDTRGTPYANYAVAYPATATNITYRNASSSGARQGKAVTRECTITAGGQASTVAAGGNGSYRERGTVNLTTVASPVAGTLANIVFHTPYSVAPAVTLTAMNLATAQCVPYISNRATTGFSIMASVAPAGTTALSFDYHTKA